MENKEKNELECLNKFSNTTVIWEKLKKFTDEVNIFEILEISNAELKHSLMISYIFTPSQSHGLGTLPLEKFFVKFDIKEDIDYTDIEVKREYKNIDILIKSDKSKVIVIIENKIKTSEHSNQLNRYKEIIDEEYEGYTKKYFYLTPNGDMSSDPENWKSLSYNDILEIIEDLKLKNINRKIRMLIEDYKELIRRKIVIDSELNKLCKKIYIKHKQAIDLIINNIEIEADYIRGIIENYLIELNEKKIINYNSSHSSNKHLRFTTNDLDEKFPIAPLPANKYWKEGHKVFYEIKIYKTELILQISFYGEWLNENKENLNKANEFLDELGFNKDNEKKEYKYLTRTFTTSSSCKDLSSNNSENEQAIKKELDKMLEKIEKNK